MIQPINKFQSSPQIYFKSEENSQGLAAVQSQSNSAYQERLIEIEEEKNSILKKGVLGIGSILFAYTLGRLFMVKSRPRNGTKESISKTFDKIKNKKVPTLNECNSLNENLKAILKQFVNFNQADTDLLKEAGVNNVNRLILSGTPGTGKSFFAKILAKTLNAEYMEVKVPDIITEWAGEGVQNLKNVFENIIRDAKKRPDKPYVVTFNEIDAYIQPVETYANGAFSKGTHWISKMEERDTFLDYLEVLAEEVPNVIIIGTTNLSPKNKGLDAAAVSRFQNIIEVPMPDKKLLEEALKMNLTRFKSGEEFIKKNEDGIKTISEKMEQNGYSFRDLDSFIDRSRHFYLEDMMNTKNKEFKFEYLEKALKHHGITDGSVVSAA